MDSITISILGNKILPEVLKEIKLFSKCNIEYYDDLNLCVKSAEKENQLVIFFFNPFNEIEINNFPSILISASLKPINKLQGALVEQLNHQKAMTLAEILKS